MTPRDSKPVQRSRNAAVGQAVGIGFAIAAGLVLPVVGGLVLDQRIGSAPLWTLIGLAAGLVLAGYELVRLSRVSSKIPVNPEGAKPAVWDEPPAPDEETGADAWPDERPRRTAEE